MSDSIHSYHNFMFPFRFDRVVESFVDRHSYYRDVSFDERVKIDNDFKSSLENSGWDYKIFKVDESNLTYNEYIYYHDFARDTLFNREDFEQNATSYYFEKKITDKSASYSINIDGKQYILELKNLGLRVFDTGISILSIEMENHQYNKMEDILKINEYGRRIYPQFLNRKENGTSWVQDTMEAFLPAKQSISFDGNTYTEDFAESYNEIPDAIRLSRVVRKILGSCFVSESEIDTTTKDQKYLIRPVLDDRMFVLSYYSKDGRNYGLDNYKYIEDDKAMELWYKFVFIDGKDITCYSPKIIKNFIKQSTYDRWMNHPHGCSLYGVTRYSFVLLSSYDVIQRHMQTIYYQLFILLLAQRASILRFSDEVTSLSDIKVDKEKEMSQRTSALYKNYIRFVNKLYFREVTPQEQGIELYDMARKIMRIDDDIKDLDNEIAELHNYVSMIEEQDRSNNMDKLSKFGYMFLPPTFVAGMFGMNIFEKDNLDDHVVWICMILSLLLGVSFAFYAEVKNFLKDKYE